MASLASGAEQLNANSSQLIAGVGQLQTGASQVEQLVTGANQLQAGLEQLASSTSLSAEQSSQIQALLTGLPQLQATINQLNDSLSSIGGLAVDTTTLSSLLTEMGAQAQGLLTAAQADKTASIEALQATATYQNLTGASKLNWLEPSKTRLRQQRQRPKRFWVNCLNSVKPYLAYKVFLAWQHK